MSLASLARGDLSRVTAFALPPAAAARWLAERAATSMVVAVTPTEDLAAQLARDARFFHPPPQASPGDPSAPPVAMHLPAIDVDPYSELRPDRSALAGRMAGLFRLAHPEVRPSIITLSAESLMRRVVEPAELAKLTTEIAVGGELDRDATAELLVRAGYARVSVVDDPGTFAVRGEVLDFFPSLYGYPLRAELFGDEIESLRTFDPTTQRTLREVDRAFIHPVRETVSTGEANLRARILEAADRAAHPSKETRRIASAAEAGEEFVGIEVLTPAFHERMGLITDYLPEDVALLIYDPQQIAERSVDLWEHAANRYQDRLDGHQLAFPPGDHFAEPDAIERYLREQSHCLTVMPLEPSTPPPETIVRASIDDNHLLRMELQRTRRENATQLMQPLVDALARWRGRDMRIALAVPSTSRRQQLAGLMAEYDVELGHGSDLSRLEIGVPTIVPRGLSTGFVDEDQRLAIVTEDEIFGERRRVSARQREAARRARKSLMGGAADFANLEVGNFLVHDVHGVGRYAGLVKLPVASDDDSGGIDFLSIEYRGGTLYLPVYRMGEVQRYVGAEGHAPPLDKLGGVTWEKSRRKVGAEVRALAEQLLQLYAQRAALPGHAFAAGDAMFSEFEATFEFEETPDQQKAIDDVVADMEQSRPMDRLVCGDVGYGKTEVALRAMLKAVLGGKQVAMLAPTTVLVEQHYQTMLSRFSGWPIQLARLSRFQKRSEQLATIKGLADGSIDAVVGTHRLLSADIRFVDLGLLVVDEEQRFGVAHKERLKRMRTQLDVLTLTATPIPRTLNLAMSGLRDLSIIATPPADRRSIRTFVARPEDQVLRDAVRRELSRGGQVFFVAPRIEGSQSGELSLAEWAERIEELVPEAVVTVAHGQMRERELEKAMLAFVEGKSTVLVSTTIVESGLDIPRANTMLIANADRFGLAQLYQLRGRIGRSKERAFCYLLVPGHGGLTDDARRRLEALQRFSDLGAGFAIASQDLEIRGAGELLGGRQSGSIAAVGFEAYARLLEDAVAELRGEEIVRPSDPELNVTVPGFIPDDYVPDTGQRLQLYKRLASAEDEDEIAALLEEVGDRYGPLPDEVRILADLMILKGLAARLRVQSLELGAERMVLAFAEKTPVDPAELTRLVQEQPERFRLTPDMRLRCQLSRADGELDNDSGPLHEARSVLLDLRRCVRAT